ncbi:MAG: MATE family efflux transporter [Balneola sp.]|nr:MATE family efflux transporter [Balneola sp.]|tara:strand:+ start:6286 stop:7629 length:1344 start_codon:yes stop_codon:yes gene_type:complete
MSITISSVQKEASALGKIGGPIVGTQLLGMGLNVTDTIMAGQLSAADLAGVAVGNALYLPIFMFGIGTLVAINPVVSHHLGGKRFDEIGKSARQMLWVVALIALPSFFLVRSLPELMPIVRIDPEIIPLATNYMLAASWGMPAYFLFSGFRYFSEGLAYTRPAMLVALGMLIVNIPADYIFMYGAFGLPQLGAEGTGYATSLVQWSGGLAMLLFTAKFKTYRRFNIFARTKGPDWSRIAELLKIGVPNALSTTMEVLLFAAVSVLMGTLSVQASAAHQVAINIAATVFMIPLGLSLAISQRVGVSIGKGLLKEARFRGFMGTAVCTGATTITAILLFSFPETIVSIYTQDVEVSNLAVSLVFFAAVFQLSDGLQVGAFGALRGLKDTRMPMAFNLISYWFIGFSVGYYLSFIGGYGPEGLWMGLIAGLTTAAMLHNTRFHLLTRNKN